MATGGTVIDLRARGLPPALAAAALTQATLRSRAVAKFGTDAAVMFFTGPGLEQATRPVVAARRAERLRTAGVRAIADLGCGIGSDALSFARKGIKVYALEADRSTFGVARANVVALGLTDLVEVHCADATTADLSGVDAVFCDPARRTGTAGRRIFDPAAYSPPWDFVASLPGRVPHTVLKLAPGIDHALIPPGAEAVWTSVDGVVVEATFWCGPLATVPRRATVLRSGAAAGLRSDVAPGPTGAGAAGPTRAGAATGPTGAGVTAELSGTGDVAAPLGAVGRYLFDLDGAVVRSHLVAEFAATVDGVLADPRISYVFADRPAITPFARCFEVSDVLPFSLKRLRAALRQRGVGRVEILVRGSPLDPSWLRRALRLSGSASATVVLTRLNRNPTALLCQPIVES